MSGDVVEVRLVAVPVDLFRRTAAHHDAIDREFDILRGDLPPGSLPDRLVTTLQENRLRFSAARDAVFDAVARAESKGEGDIDLVVPLPVSAGEMVGRTVELLRDVDDYCRRGEHLLTLVTPPDLVAFREWLLEEVVRQLEGRPARSWTDYLAEHPEWGTRQVAPPPGVETHPGEDGPTTIQVTGDLDVIGSSRLRDSAQELHNAGVRHVVVDLTSVDFVDSVGLSLLVTIHNRIAAEGGTLRLRGTAKLRKLLELTGLDGVLHVERG